MKSLRESLFDKDLATSKTDIEKITEFIKHFLGDKVEIDKYWSIDGRTYFINNYSIINNKSKLTLKSVIQYCKRNKIEFEQEKINAWCKLHVSMGDYWIIIKFDAYGGLMDKIEVSKDLYDSGVFPING